MSHDSPISISVTTVSERVGTLLAVCSQYDLAQRPISVISGGKQKKNMCVYARVCVCYLSCKQKDLLWNISNNKWTRCSGMTFGVSDGDVQLCIISVSVSTAAFSAQSKPHSVRRALTTTCRVRRRARW